MPATNTNPIFTLVQTSENKCNTYIADIEISNVLKQLGIRPKYCGFNYLKTALKLCYENYEEYSLFITKRLYPEIASLHNVNAATVERCIRYAIADMYCEDSTKYKILGYTADGYTNKEFINSVTEYLRCL